MVLRKVQRNFSRSKAYALALAIFLLALAIRLLLLPVDMGLAFLTFFPAMVLTFSLCGVGPGIFFTVLSTPTAYFIFFTPYYSFEHNLEGEIAAITYLISAALIAKVIGQLRMTSAYLRELLDNSPAGIVTIDPSSGKLCSANRAALKMWGYSEQEIQTKTFADLFSAHEEATSAKLIEALFRGEVDSLHFENRYHGKDGNSFWAETYASTVKDANGKVKMLVGNSTDITERKRLETEINQLNRDFISFLENTSDFIYFKDQDSRFRFCSQTLANITGHNSWREMIGKHDLEVFPDETAKIYFEEEQPIFRDGTPLLNQIDPYYDASGNKGWVSTNKWPIFNETGQVIGIFGISHDMTEFKKLQETVQVSEARYRTVLEDLTELICRFKTDGTLLYVNDAYCRFFGISKQAVLETSWQPVAYQADLPHILEQLTTLTPEHDVVTIENRVIAADNQLRWGQFINRAFFDEQGHLIEIQAVGRDITDRKSLELVLQNENEKNQALLRNASDGIHILDQDGNILEVSDSFCSMLGYSREELLGMHVTQWDAGFSTLDEIKAVIKQQFESSSRCQFETRHRRKDGIIFDVEISGKALMLGGKQVIFNSSRDITERKQLAAKLAQSAKEIEDLYEHAPCGYHSLGPDGKFIFINATGLAWLGCTKEELIGKKTPNDFFTLEGRALFEKKFPEFVKNGYLKDLEFEIVGHNTPPRFVRLSATAIVDDNGTFLMSRSVLFDITQTKQAQDALLASEERFRIMANSAPVLIWIAGLDKARNWFNKIWLNFTGRSLEQEMGHGWAEGVHPDDFERCLGSYTSHFDRREQFRIEYRLRRHDGVYRWIDGHGVPLLDSMGNFSGYIGSCIDITESKEMSLQLQNALQNLEKQTSRLQTILKNASDGIHIMDVSGNLLQFSDSFANMLGYSHEEAARLNISDWDAEFPKQQLANIINDQDNPSVTLETRHSRKDGSVFDVEINATVIILDDKPCMYASSRDISDRKLHEDKLKQLSLEQHAMLDNDLIGIAKVRDRQILWKNKAMDRIFGYQADELIGAPMRILYPDFLAYQELGDAAYPALQATGSYRTQLEMLRKDGKKIWADLSGGLLSRQGAETIWMMADITAIKQHEAEMAKIAYHDILTGLPNRLLIADRLQQALAQAERSNRMLAVCYLDLDGFKPVNDNYGHQAGDLLLKEVADRMQATVRANDTVGRLGGDEFVLLLTNLENVDEYRLVVERLISAINQPIALNASIQVNVGVSIGITVFPTDSDDPDILLRHADQAMYRAKQTGRNKVCLFSPDQQ